MGDDVSPESSVNPCLHFLLHYNHNSMAPGSQKDDTAPATKKDIAGLMEYLGKVKNPVLRPCTPLRLRSRAKHRACLVTRDRTISAESL